MTNLNIESTQTTESTSTENTAMNDTNTEKTVSESLHNALQANIAKGKKPSRTTGVMKSPKAPKKSKADAAAEALLASTASDEGIIDRTKPSKSQAKRVAVQKGGKSETASIVVTDGTEVVQVKPFEVIESAVKLAVANARSIHSQMKANFIDGIKQIAEQVIAAKAAAKAEGVRFESLFGNPDDASQFPFSQNWANTIVRVYESNLLFSADLPRLPSDLTTLATLASTKPEKREAVLKRYEEIRTGDFNFIDGEIVLAKVTTQKAMKKAKAEVEGEGADEVSVKAPKQFNAKRMARALLTELGHDGLADLAEAIDELLEQESVEE